MKKMLWTISIIIVLIIGLFSWIAKGTIYQSVNSVPKLESITNTNFKVIAHRGYSSKAPENTLSAFKLALDCQADMIELDIHLSKDNQVVVIHDATLKRTSGQEGTIQSKTLAELKQLEVGSWFGKDYANEPIPTLEETIQLVNEKSILLIELKVDENNEVYKGLVAETLKVIEKYQASSWCILQAFDSQYLKEIQTANVNIPYHKLIVNTHEPLPTFIDTKLQWGSLDESIGYSAVNPYYKTLTPNQVKIWQSKGYEVYTYTVNELDNMKQIVDMGVNGLITNYPKRAINLRKSLQ